jgi:predicted AAA+ superfamily ATPase
VRNALIGRFEEFSQHPDRGQLWESWAITERCKAHFSAQNSRPHYFWRLKSGAEVDLVEEVSGKLLGIKYKTTNRKVSAPDSFHSLYPNSTWRVVEPNSFDEQGLTD